MKKKSVLDVWVSNNEKYRNSTYPAELRNGNFEHGFDTGCKEGAKWLLRYIKYKTDKVQFLNDERYFGACDLIQILEDEIDAGQGGDDFKKLEFDAD